MFMEIFNMKLTSIHTGNFKLDGGAMFGVVPKQLWQNLNPADDKNLCNWAMRCLLVQFEGRNILIDTGIGNKQNEKFYSHYYLNGDFSLEASLKQAGLRTEDITDVILTHLHFDHCGGAVKRVNDELLPNFENAQYYVNQAHWESAMNPNPREKASFLKENFEPLLLHGKLQFVNHGDIIANCIEVHVFYGHTHGMIAPLIKLPQGEKLFYGADLFPSSAHLKPHFVMSYDIEPLKTMEERERINQMAVEEKWWYFYEHDLAIEVSQVGLNDKGQPEPINSGKLSEVLL